MCNFFIQILQLGPLLLSKVFLFEDFIRLDECMPLDLMVASSVLLLLVKLLVVKSDQSGLLVFSTVPGLQLRLGFLLHLLLKVAQDVLILRMVEVDSFGETLATLSLDQSF